MTASGTTRFGTLRPGKHFESSACASRKGWFARRTLLAAFVLIISVPRPAHAIVDKNNQNNTTPIGEDTTWTGGDPGWDNVTINNTNYTYLGDGWVIGARHSGVWTAFFGTGSFTPIPGKSFIVPNPSDWPIELTGESDLQLIRINGDPGLPSLTIASQPPPLNGEVVFIGQGRGRATNPTQWDSDWNEVTSGGTYQGYKSAGADTKRWGTNVIASDEPFFDKDADPQYNVKNDPDLNHVFALSNRNVVSLLTTFDQSGGTAHESQAISGNSGSAVFYKRGGQWELSGVINATLNFEDQPAAWAVYDNATAFSDLSVYRDEIYNIINSNPEYSVMGDINLDGVVSGDGRGTWDIDDVTAFIEGWRYEQGTHSVESWKKGDLSLDGKTDLSDFLLMRNALLGSGSGAGAAALASLLGVTVSVVPEPSSAALLLIGVMFMFGMAKRRSCVAAL